MPTPTIIPMLAYANGPKAMDWLAEAFGFKERERWLSDEGQLEHGEMESGSGVIMLATPSLAYEGPTQHRTHCATADAWLSSPYVVDGVLVYVDDIEAHFARAKAAGAVLLSDVEESPVGHLYRTEDLEGHRWMFLQAAQPS